MLRKVRANRKRRPIWAGSYVPRKFKVPALPGRPKHLPIVDYLVECLADHFNAWRINFETHGADYAGACFYIVRDLLDPVDLNWCALGQLFDKSLLRVVEFLDGQCVTYRFVRNPPEYITSCELGESDKLSSVICRLIRPICQSSCLMKIVATNPVICLLIWLLICQRMHLPINWLICMFDTLSDLHQTATAAAN